VLGQIGPPAAAALPRLRKLLADNYEWNRVHAAAAIWDIGGESEAPVVLDTLLQAWQKNPATGNHVAACLKRMGSAAVPALPQIRAELARPERGVGSEVSTTTRNCCGSSPRCCLSIEVSGPDALCGR
jgi:hypothetical protein